MHPQDWVMPISGLNLASYTFSRVVSILPQLKVGSRQFFCPGESARPSNLRERILTGCGEGLTSFAGPGTAHNTYIGIGSFQKTRRLSHSLTQSARI